MKKNHILGLLFAIFSILNCSAANNLNFDAKTIDFAGINMPYRIASVNSDSATKPALVIYLHGGSSKGDDNEKQLLEAGIDSIAYYLEAKNIKALFIVPQCPSDKSWGGPMLGVLKSLIDRYKENIVDPNRIYMFGGSMGGTGLWSMLSAYPGLFAAAMPIAGNPSKCDATTVSKTPLFTVMGTADRIMNVETTADFVNKLRNLGCDCMFEIEDDWTHEMTCTESYTTLRLDWVFKHSLDDSGVESVEADNSEICTIQYFSIVGKVITKNMLDGLFIERIVYKNGEVKVRKIFM